MRHHAFWCAATIALSLATASANGAGSSTRNGGEILWDIYGIPHIYGPDLLTVVRGYGYAQMENQAETLLTNIAAARGRLAEYFGPGDGDANVQSDTLVRTEGIPDRAALWLQQGDDFQRAVLDAFVAGSNEYAAIHGDTIAPAIRRVLPLVATDILAGEQKTVHFTIMPEQDHVSALISAWQTAGLAAANALA